MAETAGRPLGPGNRRWTTAVGAVVFGLIVGVVAIGGFFMFKQDAVTRTTQVDIPEATADDATAVGQGRVFFAHQSVGQNLIDALPEVTSRLGVAEIPVTGIDEADRGIAEVAIGVNGDPLGKLEEFASLLRGGLAHRVDIAVLKFCFMDFEPPAPPAEEVFEAYRATMGELETEFPDVTFVYTTVPLVTDRTIGDRVQNLLGRSTHRLPTHNVAREEFNSRIRAEYAGTGRLFDIASFVAADAGGTVTYRESGGREYAAMDGRLAADPGHLNPDGAAFIGSAFVAFLAGLD